MLVRLSKYLIELRRNANRLERVDINGIPATSFFLRNQKRIICLAVSTAIASALKEGFSNEFVSYVSNVLSILVGLFITALIFCFDKFYEPQKPLSSSYEVSLKKEASEIDRKYELEICKIENGNSTKRLWDIQSYNYAKQFSYITGYNIALAIFCLVFLALSSLFEEPMRFNPSEYKFSLNAVDKESVINFCWGILVIVQRISVLYWIGCIVYNTLFIVSSMVNFMSVKNDINND